MSAETSDQTALAGEQRPIQATVFERGQVYARAARRENGMSGNSIEPLALGGAIDQLHATFATLGTVLHRRHSDPRQASVAAEPNRSSTRVSGA
jgi:hypothetical protein